MTLPFHSDFTCQYYSKNDFLRQITSRIKKDLKLQGGVDIKQSYQISGQGPVQEILTQLLKEIFHDHLSLDSGSPIAASRHTASISAPT
jgi:hypothetical protein